MPMQGAVREELRNDGASDGKPGDRDSTEVASAGDRKRKRVKVPSGSDRREPDIAEARGAAGRPKEGSAALSGRVPVRKSEDDYCYICAGNSLIYMLGHSTGPRKTNISGWCSYS